MLSFITGPEGSRKFERVIEKAREVLENTNKRVMIIVPEQISFQTERKCLEQLGAALSLRVDVLSFTRLCHLVFKTYGGRVGNYANQLSKHMVMELALEEMKDGLELYADSVGKEGFSSLMLQTVEELKSSGITPENFEIDLLGGKLKKKSDDISLIYSAYQGMLEKTYRDPSDDLARAIEILKQNDFFEQYNIFFHEFIQFSGQQREMASLMLIQTDVCVSICLDKNSSELFHTADVTLGRLKQIASRFNVKIKVPEKLEQEIENPEISWVEKNILHLNVQAYNSEVNSVKIIQCENEYNESEEILSEVWELVKQGYRFKDITLVTGDLINYRSVIENALDKYQIPYFMDETFSVCDYALMQCVSSLLEAATGYELPLDVLKSGVTEFDIAQVSVFENYIYVWNIRPSQLKQPFTQNPRGFITTDRVTEQDKVELELAEEIRQKIVKAVDIIKNAEHTARAYGQAIMEALSLLQVPQTFEAQIQKLEDDNNLVQAQEQGRVWEIMVEIFETIDRTAIDFPMTIELYFRLFKTAVNEYDMGSIPQSTDCVIVGDSGRMILDNPKIVFVFGANDGVFPKQPTEQGIFTDFDREQLEQAGIELSSSITEKSLENRLQAYRILSAPKERLYLTLRHASISGESKQNSEVVEQLTKIFGDQIVTNSSEDLIHLCQTKDTAFQQLAFNFRENNGEVAALKQYFSSEPVYGSKLIKLSNSTKPAEFKITEKETAEKLFGKNMRVSPSQAETYYKCPFSYFCRSGMKAYPRRKADLDPLSIGTVVHHVMEHILKIEGFSALNEKQLSSIIGEILDKFFDDFLGGNLNKSARFVTQYKSLKERLIKLAKHIQSEFSVSKFRPIAFEMKINDDSEIKPVILPLSNKGGVKIIGEIDRVDTCEENGKTYLRVVDYKSGKGKKFNISDLYYGLSMQMLIYLFSLWENGNKKFNDPISAGILYMPAGGADDFKLNKRDDNIAQLEKALDGSFSMNGLLLNDMDVIQAMEEIGPGQKGKYIPVSMEKEQSQFTKTSLEFLISEEEMERIKKFTMKEITKMCEGLLSGEVEAYPLRGYGAGYCACDNCEYITVCGHDASHGYKETESFNKTEFMQRIQEEQDD